MPLQLRQSLNLWTYGLVEEIGLITREFIQYPEDIFFLLYFFDTTYLIYLPNINAITETVKLLQMMSTDSKAADSSCDLGTTNPNWRVCNPTTLIS